MTLIRRVREADAWLEGSYMTRAREVERASGARSSEGFALKRMEK